MKYDFDTMNVQELFELIITDATAAAMEPQMKQLVEQEREHRKLHLGGGVRSDDHLHWVDIDMRDGQPPQRLSTEFVEAYRKLLAEHYVAPSEAELFANSIEGMPVERLLQVRPPKEHFEKFMPEFRELMGKNMSGTAEHLAAGGSYDDLVCVPAGRSSFVTYTHEFVKELRALQIHYRDLPKAAQP